MFLRGQPRLALLFCWSHLPNLLLLYFTIIFHVILCYVFVFVFAKFEFGNKIHSFIHSIIHSFKTRLRPDSFSYKRIFKTLIQNAQKGAFLNVISAKR